MPFRRLALCIGLTLLPLIGGAQSKSPTVESVEAQLEAKRREAERINNEREDAVRRQKEAQQAEARRVAEATRALEAKLRAEAATAPGTLILQADADCALSLDGEAQGPLRAGQPRSLTVAPGEQLVQCSSSAHPEIVVEQVQPVAAGSKQVLKLTLAARLPRAVDTRTAGSVFRDRLKDGSEGPEMVVIPAGSFQMGSPEGEVGRISDEGPQHPVTLPTFAMGRTEVTVAQFRHFVEAKGYRTDAERNTAVNGSSAAGCYTLSADTYGYVDGRSWRTPGFAQDDTHPAVCLSHNDALAYVQWLAEETGKPYRLPSEAQQEYSLRAGTQTVYAWGPDINGACAVANVCDQFAASRFSGGVDCDDGALYTAPVATRRANAFGLFDTTGNVWEWGADCWNENYVGAPQDGSAWTSGDCSRRVLRGAGWFNYATFLRAAIRFWLAPANRSNITGFRLIQDL